MTTNDILRGELERLFELDEMMALTEGLLGLSPADVGGTSGKGTYARALVERCAADDSLVALSDAMMFTKKGVKDADLFANAEDIAPGTMVGGFKIGKKLGEGGTNIVYQTNKNNKKITLKVIKLTHTHARTTNKH